MMHKERGNILFIILLAVVLFAALSYAVTGGGRVSEDQRISTEKAQTVASQIVNYTALLENTVQRLRITNECSDAQISFQNSVVSGYTSGAPTKCKVFDPAGGGMAWQTPDPSWLISQSDANAQSAAGVDYGIYNIPTEVCVLGMGTGSCDSSAGTKDMIIALKYLNKKVCDAINDKLGISPPPSDNCYAGANGSKYVGTFFNGGQYICNATRGMSTACVDTQGRTGYTYYRVLWAR